MPKAIDAMDTYGIKATIAVSTQGTVIGQLWPRLRAAVANGHEIGSHSRRHQCQWPDTEAFCRAAYSRDEIEGSRDDILAQTDQGTSGPGSIPAGTARATSSSIGG